MERSFKMVIDKILEVVLREMRAYGTGWRINWVDFDGRSLRFQLDSIAEWAEKAKSGEIDKEYTSGSDFEKDQQRF